MAENSTVVAWSETRVIPRARLGRFGALATAGRALCGIGGLVVGLGIGVPHLIEGALTVHAVAALGSLVAGTTVVARAGMRRLRRPGRVRRVIDVAVAAATAVLVVFPLTLAVAVTDVVHVHEGTRTPADADLPYRPVVLRTSDGVDLAAWYVPSTNGAAVVLLGGATAVRADELDHAAVLARRGYGVLLVDHRGLGASDGDAMLWGWYGELDVRAAVDYLSSRPDIDATRIGAVGMSMGAEEAIGAATLDSRLRAVVAEGASGRGPRDEGDRPHGVGGALSRYVDWTATRAAALMTSAPRPSSLIRSIRQAPAHRTLLIAAGTRPNEIAAGLAMQAAAPGSVTLWIAIGAGHTTAYDTSPAEWETRVIGFLDASLAAAEIATRDGAR